eukprot:7148137-Lingulodinium_polyedra.AAC.1
MPTIPRIGTNHGCGDTRGTGPTTACQQSLVDNARTRTRARMHARINPSVDAVETAGAAFSVTNARALA